MIRIFVRTTIAVLPCHGSLFEEDIVDEVMDGAKRWLI